MKKVYLYYANGVMVTYPDRSDFIYTERSTSDMDMSLQIKTGDIVEVFAWGKDGNTSSIKKVIEIRHQHIFIPMDITDRGWRHWMKFQDIQEVREEKLDNILRKSNK